MDTNFSSIARVAISFTFLALAACGGGDNDGGGINPPPPPPPPPQTGIGAAGGVVTGPGGAKVEIPAGALTTNVDVKVEQSSAGSPALPAGFTAVGSMFAFTPHGTTFTAPVAISLPFDPKLVPAGSAPVLYKTNAQDQWELVANASFGSSAVTGEITSFSFAQILIPPLVRNDPTRSWSFGGIPGNGGPEIDFGGGTRSGGLLEELADFGIGLMGTNLITSTQTIPADGRARGFVFGTESGVTYGAFAEAPFAPIGGSDPIGSISRLTQSQSFIKRADNASLKFKLTAVEFISRDYNLFAPSIGHPDTTLTAEVYFEVRAFSPTHPTIFLTAGGAMTKGTRTARVFNGEAWNYPFARTPLWTLGSFGGAPTNKDIVHPNFAHCLGMQAEMKLVEPLPFTIDLSSVAIGEEFTLRSEIFAAAQNRRGGGSAGDCEESGVQAYIRDPLEMGGATLEFSGLEPTNRPLLTVPAEVPEEPAACTPDPEPSGTIQFSASSFMVAENTGAIPTVKVTRTGGTRGAVTATFTSSDGSAVAGSDYSPINATVFFADGDSEARVIRVPITADSADEPDETVNLTLSQPGGCAQLGDQSSTVLTIADDDLPPPTGLPGALDATFGTGGKANIERFGGDRSAMALQPDGKIVMVGGTFTDFILARFNADGSVDSTFDGDGQVTTKIVSGQQQEALAVVVQPDGKIVVAGYSGPPGGGPASVALARYMPDGSLDAGFGSQGKVVSDVAGEAYAITIQPDGKLLVAGRSPRASGADTSDFVVARFAGDGALDATFAAGGVRITDIGGATNTARNIVLQTNGAIVVSGQSFDSNVDHTDIVRYDANGNLDGTFGTGGMLALSGTLVGHGLAVSADGKLVLVGSVIVPGTPVAASQFLVRRLNEDGSTDNTFGASGSVVTDISGRGDEALAVALQQDGKIVVAGISSLQTNPDFAVTRYLVSGALDTSFANAGKQTVDFFGFTDGAESAVVQPDGKIVVGGFAKDNFDGYGVARINP
jgi:uncharacterized delta-60 repeat protein